MLTAAAFAASTAAAVWQQARRKKMSKSTYGYTAMIKRVCCVNMVTYSRQCVPICCTSTFKNKIHFKKLHQTVKPFPFYSV